MGRPGPCRYCGEPGERRLIGDAFAYLCDLHSRQVKKEYYRQQGEQQAGRKPSRFDRLKWERRSR